MRGQHPLCFVGAGVVAIGLTSASMILAAPPQAAGPPQAGRGPATPAPSATENGEFTIRPPWSSAPETIYDNNIPHGVVHRFTMKSSDSRIYPGIARGVKGVVPYERPVAVYIPAQYVPGMPAPFLVVQDGFSAKYHSTVPIVLDKLIAEKRVPVMLA